LLSNLTAERRPARLRQGGFLFDYLVGAGEQCGRQFKVKQLRSLEVDYQLIFGRLLHGQLGWLGPSFSCFDSARGLDVIDFFSAPALDCTLLMEAAFDFRFILTILVSSRGL
jgi:hypothetical protein